MQQIYRRASIPKCDFNKVPLEIPLWHGCSPVNLLHIFRISFHKNTYGRLLLIHGFKEVTKIFENMQNVLYFVNLQDLGSSFTTEELLRSCFTKTKVIRYTTFFEFGNNYFSELFHIYGGRELP